MDRKLMEHEIEAVLRTAISSDYTRDILENEDSNGKTLLDAIVENVIETSAVKEEDYYNDDDIRLAIGREILERLAAKKDEKTEYVVRSTEEELGDILFKVTVPSGTDKEDVIEAFLKATKYLYHSSGYEVGIDKDFYELRRLYDEDYSKYVELGRAAYDEYFEKMLEVQDSHRLEIFKYYISNCKGWKIEEIESTYDFEFEW